MSELTCRTPSGSPRNVAGWGLWPLACMFGVWGRVAWSADAGNTPTSSVNVAATRMDNRMRERMCPSFPIPPCRLPDRGAVVLLTAPLPGYARRLGQRAGVAEDEQAEVPVAGQDDAVTVLVLGQGHAPEVVAVGVDVVAHLGGVGGVRDVDNPEAARVPGEVRELVVVRRRAALVGVAPRHLYLVDRQVAEASRERRVGRLGDGDLADLGRCAGSGGVDHPGVAPPVELGLGLDPGPKIAGVRLQVARITQRVGQGVVRGPAEGLVHELVTDAQPRRRAEDLAALPTADEGTRSLPTLGAGVVVGDDHHVVPGLLAGTHLVGEEAGADGVVRVVHRAALEDDDRLLLGAQRAEHRGIGHGIARAAVAAEHRRAVHHLAREGGHLLGPAELTGIDLLL